ncbi:hypothetical protein [Bacteriovorax sp. Seq25_V]|uniref:hypothetical protein n=1 Tax=Bacteriovorax sp. Seq25_V TaxID=1201288 RepID=UPI00038A47CE|nr:hypothetical protein [Bacteriovorax sp. Seq25_V]EQC47281.1 hypothetical protein M900_0581 [Bacteriovorax sp. Seq25_V]
MKNFELSLQNLEQNKFLSGDLFWNKKSGKKVLISSAGTFIDENFVKKLLEKNEVLEIVPFGNLEFQSEMKIILENLKSAEHEVNRVEVRENLQALLKNYIDDSYSLAGIDLVIPFMEKMYAANKEVETIFLERNSELFIREVFIASTLICLAIEEGYLDFNFLRETFNTELTDSYFLAEARIGVFHLKELERLRVGEIEQFSKESLMFRLSNYGERASLLISTDELYKDSLIQLCSSSGRSIDHTVTSDLIVLKGLIEEEVSYLNIDIKQIDFKKFRKSISRKEKISKYSKVINFEEVS